MIDIPASRGARGVAPFFTISSISSNREALPTRSRRVSIASGKEYGHNDAR